MRVATKTLLSEIISLFAVQFTRSGNCDFKFPLLLWQFWEILCAEHGIDEEGQYNGRWNSQLEKINVYFAEGAGR